MTSNQLPLVWVLGTGGTISSWGSPRLTFFEYGVAGQRLDVHQNLERIPEVSDFANVKAEHLWMAGSGGLGPTRWLELTKKINGLFQEDPGISGIVVTHGTSSMEETAYWLNLTVKSEKSVVVTGTMRPPSAMGTDSDNNLLGAIILAGSQEARGKGVTVMLNDEINAAREVTKQNAYRIETFGTREMGFLGYLDSDLKPMFYREPVRKHTYQTEFDVDGLSDLPKVYIVYAYEGADDLVVRALIDAKAPGIVIAGMGAGGAGGQVQQEALMEASRQGSIVLSSTRAGAGRVIRTSRHREAGWVAADNLSPHKARILLQLALTKTNDPEEIQRMFDAY